MSKKMTKSEAKLVTMFLIVGAPIYLIYKISESIGWIIPICIIIFTIFIIIWVRSSRKKKKHSMLMAKYSDSQIVNKLMQKYFWQGQTSEMLIDSLGQPQAVDSKVLKTKKKEIWKYNHSGGNRYGLRITLDNDIVVGWDQK